MNHSSYKLVKCKYGRQCRTKKCMYDHSEAVMRWRDPANDDDDGGDGRRKRARLDDTDKKLITHEKSLSEDDLKVYEVQDMFPSIDFTRIHECMALHNYDTQKCVEFLFDEQSNKSNTNEKTNTSNNNNNNNISKTDHSSNSTNNDTSMDLDKSENNIHTNTSPTFDNNIEIDQQNNETLSSSSHPTTTSTPPSSTNITDTNHNNNEKTNNQTTNSHTTSNTTTSTSTATSSPFDGFDMIDGDSIQCKICLETKKIDFMFVMQQCGHGFCRECVSGYFTSKINDRVSPIKCPDYGCKKEATEFDLEMVLDRKMIDKFADNSFHNAIRKNPEMFSCCPTPDCPYVFFYTLSDSPDFGCPTCKKRYCLKCRVAYHSGSTCEEYQKWSVDNGMSDDLFRDFVRGHKFKQCAKCKHWVEKTEGCNHMTCICEHEFCYRCGGDYGEGCECGDDYDEEDEDEGEGEEEDENDEY